MAMQINKYNLNKLVRVQCLGFRKTREYRYKKQKKFLGLTTRKAGIYEFITNDYLGFEVPKNYTLKCNVVYENPSVTLFFEGGFSDTHYFDSCSDAEEFVAKLADDNNFKYLKV